LPREFWIRGSTVTHLLTLLKSRGSSYLRVICSTGRQ
jgi:hypothetical protein